MAKKKVRTRIDLDSLSISEILPSKAELDAALGTQVSNSSFEKIVKSIGIYFVFAKAQHEVVANGDLVGELLQLEKMAEKVRSSFTSRKQLELPNSVLTPRDTWAAEDAAYRHLHSLLTQLPTKIPPKIGGAGALTNLPKIRPPFETVRASFFVQLLDVTTHLSRWITTETRKPFSNFTKGFSWDFWIVLLRAIMKRDGLPYGVSKATVSPFVKFVRAAQLHMPAQFQRHMHSDDALGQAIIRARKEMNFDPDIDELWDDIFSSLQ